MRFSRLVGRVLFDRSFVMASERSHGLCIGKKTRGLKLRRFKEL